MTEVGALRHAAEIYDIEVHTRSMRYLRTALLPYLDCEDDEVFLLVTRALLQHEPEAGLERCERMLAAEASQPSQEVFMELQRFPGHMMPRILATMLEQLPTIRWLRKKVHYAALLGSIIVPAALEDIVATGPARRGRPRCVGSPITCCNTWSRTVEMP